MADEVVPLGPVDKLAKSFFSMGFLLLAVLLGITLLVPLIEIPILPDVVAYSMGICFTLGGLLSGSSKYGMKKLVSERAKYATIGPWPLWIASGAAFFGVLVSALFMAIFRFDYGNYLLIPLLSFLHAFVITFGLGYIFFTDLGKKI
jgi:hypothetical protein